MIETSVLKLSEVLSDNLFFRIDSEYFQKEFLQTDRKLRSAKFDYLKNLISLLTDGKHGGVDFTEEGVLFLRNTNVKAGVIDLADKRFISHEESSETLRAELEEGDILLTTIGSIVGESVVIPKNFPKATINQNLVRIVPKNKLMSEYISTFFNSKYGINQIYRFAAGNIWFLVNYPNLREVKIPLFSDKFYASIKTVLQKRDENLYQSALLYEDAEQNLLKELKMFNWQPTEKNTAIKKFSHFENSSRLDAEYYQPKYDEIDNKIKSYPNGFKFLNSIINVDDENFEPGENVEYNYIELADIGNTGEIKSCTSDFGKNLPSRARRVVKTNDVIISSIEGSLDKCAFVSSNFDNSLCSTGFYVINSKQILPEVLLLLFKSYPLQQLMKQRCSGTILTAMNKDELSNMPVPTLPTDKQKELAKKIKNSFKLREESNRLIETAKQAVEIAIEKDEKAAIKFLS